jgi:hypothetical protein
MPDDTRPDENGTEPIALESIGDADRSEPSSTVGTGSVLGLGCLVVVVVLVLLAIAFRLLGGRW